MPLRKFFPWITLRAEILIAACAVIWVALTAGFVTYSVSAYVNSSQRNFCQLLHDLTSVPPASPGNPYAQQIHRDLVQLEARFGC